jgi:hypothetical protein
MAEDPDQKKVRECLHSHGHRVATNQPIQSEALRLDWLVGAGCEVGLIAKSRL